MSLRIVVLSLALFIGLTDSAMAQGRETRTRFPGMDENQDGRITRDEWRGNERAFRDYDWNRDGVLSGRELRVDARRPGRRAAADRDLDSPGDDFEALDTNRDGRLSREEFERRPGAQTRSATYQAGYQRGLTEGATAGREDRERNQPWDIEGQREMQSANSGYVATMGPLQEYQTGYRDGFRRAYPDAFNGERR